jgi:hypothetical protein
VTGGATDAAGAVEAVEPVGADSVGAAVSGEPMAGDAAAETGEAADELAVAGSEQAAP